VIHGFAGVLSIMELDLSKYNAASLEIRTTLQVGKPELAALNQCYSERALKKPDDFIEFGTDKIINKQKHSARGVVNIIDSKKIEIYIYYTLGVLSKISGLSKLQPLSKMLSCLINANRNKPFTFKVIANFKYPMNKFKSRMALPIKLSDDDNFDEVKGVRLVKLADGKNLFSLIIDCDSKHYYHTAIFSYVGNISESLPKIIFDEAIGISKRGLNE
jgi:hypothetical protein